MKHTARTRSNDVFPAFCSPIMVTSSSVALQRKSEAALDSDGARCCTKKGARACHRSYELRQSFRMLERAGLRLCDVTLIRIFECLFVYNSCPCGKQKQRGIFAKLRVCVWMIDKTGETFDFELLG